MKKFIVLSSLIAMLVFSSLSSYAEGKVFKDVPQNHWAYTSIHNMQNLGIINGVSNDKFEPNGNLTNAQMVTLLINLTDLYKTNPQQQTVLPYKDVKTNDWYYKSLLKAYNLGIIGQNEKFNPNEYIDRETTIYMMGKLLNIIHDNNNNSYLNLFTENKDLITPVYDVKNKKMFADENEIADANTIKQMTVTGIINGKNNPDPKGLPVFDPNGKLTRAEAATLMNRYYQFIESLTITENKTIVDNGAPFVINHKGYDLTVSVDMSTVSNYAFVIDITDIKVSGDTVTIVYSTSPATTTVFNSPVKANPKDSYSTKVQNQTYKYVFQKSN